MHPLWIAGLIGGGALLFLHESGNAKKSAAEALAAGSLPAGGVSAFSLDSKEVHAAVAIALKTETSPANLSAFSTALTRAGYLHSGHELAVKASNLL
jgi:hypothetical protein